MTSSIRLHRHLRSVPTAGAGSVGTDPGGRANGALPAALKFLAELTVRPVNIRELHDKVSAESARSWANFHGASAWMVSLDKWILGPICYVGTDGRTLAYLPIYRRTAPPSSSSSSPSAGRPAGMLTLIWASPEMQWHVNGLTTL